MMTSIWASLRGLPAALTKKRKEIPQAKGTLFEVSKCSEYGFIDNPSCMAYDPTLGFFAIGNRQGIIKVLGKPGVECSAQLESGNAISKLQFMHKQGLIVSADVEGCLHLWRMECAFMSGGEDIASRDILRLHHLAECLQAPMRATSVFSKFGKRPISDDQDSSITALCCSSEGNYVLYGTDNGNLGILRLNSELTDWTWPSAETGAYPVSRLIERMSRNLHRLISVNYFTSLIHIEEFTSINKGQGHQFLLAYSSGMIILLDVTHDRVRHVFLSSSLTAPILSPCAESTPIPSHTNHRGSQSHQSHNIRMNHMTLVSKIQLLSEESLTEHGNYSYHSNDCDVVTSYEDGSLQGWTIATSLQERLDGRADEISSPKRVSHRPYGPFQCSPIHKVICVDVDRSRLTIAAGGLPRSSSQSHHTVSIMEQYLYHGDTGTQSHSSGSSSTNAHSSGVESNLSFHAGINSRERFVCLDLSSPLIDMVVATPRIPGRGAYPILILLLREELAAIDLSHPEWRPIFLPYLSCLHLSNITDTLLLSQVDVRFLESLEDCWWRQVTQNQVLPPGVMSNHNSTTRQVAGDHCDYWFARHPLRLGCDILSSSCCPFQGDAATLVRSSKVKTTFSMRTPATMLSNEAVLMAKSIDTKNDQLLLTGHEDGSVNFWRVSGYHCLRRIFSLKTGRLFEDNVAMTEEEMVPYMPFSSEWPPFRPLGFFDPLTDDPILSVRTMHLMLPSYSESTSGNSTPSNALLLVGGATGQVTIWSLPTQPASVVFTSSHISNSPSKAPHRLYVALEGSEKLAWKGFPAPNPASDETLLKYMNKCCPGIVQPVSVIQLSPPASIKCIACERVDSSLFIAISTLPGFCVVRLDLSLLRNNKSSNTTMNASNSPFHIILLNHSTLPSGVCSLPSTSSAAGAAAAQEQAALEGDGWAGRRSKMFKDSLRESFRNLRRKTSKRQLTIQKKSEGLEEHVDDGNDYQEREIVAKRVQAESPTDSSTSAFLFHLSKVDLKSSSRSTSQSSAGISVNLLVGSNGGRIRVYNVPLDFISSSKLPYIRHDRELQLAHRSPIIYLKVISNISSARTGKRGPDLLHVVSEEQLRIYTFHKFALKNKYRLTGQEGLRIQQANLVVTGSPISNSLPPRSISNSNISQLSSAPLRHFLLVNTDKGQLMVFHGDNLSRLDCINYLPSSSKIAINSVHLSTQTARAWYNSASGQVTVVEVRVPQNKNIRESSNTVQWNHHHNLDADYSFQADVSLLSEGDTVHSNPNESK